MKSANAESTEWLQSHTSQLLSQLQSTLNLTSEEADAAVHALIDILQSIEAVSRLLPTVLHDAESADSRKDRLWGIREELRHIDYHVHDSGILDW